MTAALANIKDLNIDVYPGPISCSLADHRCNRVPAWLAKDPGQPVRVLPSSGG
jgi:branched-chain amino acid transport system substrate-binding protein